ncbi:unnamed protein product [Cunninghamella blakesleeana]
MNSLQYNSSTLYSINANEKDVTKQIYHDLANGFNFTVTRKNGTVYISPLNTEGLVELKIGVLLPIHQQDSNYTQVITLSGISAIRMAVAEINTHQLIKGAYITLIEQDSFPKYVEGQAAVSQAVYSAVSLIHEGVIAIIGDLSSSWTALSALMTSTLQMPQCSFSAVATSLSDKTQYGHFFRTIPTELIYADAITSFVKSQQWPMIGIFYSSDDPSDQLSEELVMQAKKSDISIKGYQSFYDLGPVSDIKSSLDTLMSTGARIIVLASTDEDAMITSLILAAHSGYINNDNVWITIGMDDTTLLKQAVHKFNDVLTLRRNNDTQLPPLPTINTNDKSTLAKIDPIVYAARTTNNLTPIQYEHAFSGGIFTFNSANAISNYPPFEQFLNKWAMLDPEIYPYGGHRNISSGNEGMAYSCMMTLGHGFSNIINNSTNATSTLYRLSRGQSDIDLSPLIFNTNYTGPEGPIILDQNGDMTMGNYYIYNFQNGTSVNIGSLIAGDLNFISKPIYFDGTTKVPSGVPPRVYLNPGYTSGLSLALLIISSFFIFLSLITMITVIIYRKYDIIRASSPFFCVLELLGFILCFTSSILFIGYRTDIVCYAIPITFNIGFSLVLGNLIAKNYRVYRIFNNIFIQQSGVKDIQLVKFSGSLILFEIIIFIIWFSFCDTKASEILISRDAYYVGCTYNGITHTASVTILCILAAFELVFATFLAFKTRKVGKSYSKYSEYKQIGVSVYNICLSALIGTIIYFLPSVDFYTSLYITASVIVWSTSFSFIALFSPKIVALFRISCDNRSTKNKVSDISSSGKKEMNPSYKSYSSQHHYHSRNLGESSDSHSNNRMQQQSFGELLSLNGVLNGGDLQLDRKPNEPLRRTQQHASDLQYQLHHRQIHHRIQTTKPNSLQPILKDGGIVDGYEGHMPLQCVFRYFPFLSTWQMQQIVLLPDASYFSYFSEQSFSGSVFKYSHASIISSEKESYLLKIHGYGFTDILIQVKNEQDLQQWYKWFNSKQQNQSSNEQNAIFSFLKKNHTTSKEYILSDHSKKSHSKENDKINMDSGLTCQYLLSDDTESNRQSSITLDTFTSNHTSLLPLPYNDSDDHQHPLPHRQHTHINNNHDNNEEEEHSFSNIPNTIHEHSSDRTLFCTTSTLQNNTNS